MKKQLKSISMLIMFCMISLQGLSQESDELKTTVSKGTIITSFNLGYIGAERDRNYNHEFEKSFKNLSYDLRLSYLITERFGVSANISSILTGQQFVDFYDDVESFRVERTNAKFGVNAGYYYPIEMNNKSTSVFFEGGVFRFSSNYEVSNLIGKVDQNYLGYTFATGLLIPLNKKLLLNLKLNRDAFQQEYIFGTSENGEFEEIRNDTKWNSDINLSVGFSIKF